MWFDSHKSKLHGKRRKLKRSRFDCGPIRYDEMASAILAVLRIVSTLSHSGIGKKQEEDRERRRFGRASSNYGPIMEDLKILKKLLAVVSILGPLDQTSESPSIKTQGL
jgi:hypothetical protein